MRKMIPVMAGKIRDSLHLRRAQVAREAKMQPGVLTWIETGRYIPYQSQLEKIAAVYRSHGWTGETASLLDEVS